MSRALSDVCEFVSDRIPVASLDLGTYISTENMRPNREGVTSAKKLPKVKTTQMFQPGDVLISNIRPYFKKIWFADRVGGCSNDVLVFRATEEYHSKFLYYVLSSDEFFEYATGTAKGTKMPRGDKRAIMLYQVPDYGKEVQEEISAILSALDNLIGENRKINHHLEQTAKLLFRNYFKDFKLSTPFTEVVQVLGGGTPKTSIQSFWNGNIPFFTPKDALSSYVLSTEKRITLTGLDNCNSKLFPLNTVFVTARGTVGKLVLAGIPMAMNQSCYALIGHKDFGQHYVYHLALEAVSNLKQKASGAVFDAIVTRDFESELVPTSPKKAVSTFENRVGPIYDTILNNCNENNHLKELRDRLLPKLISGEIFFKKI